MINVSERLISELVSNYYAIKDGATGEEVRANISEVVSKFHIRRIDDDTVQMDILDNIGLFLASKRLEGLSDNTLKGYDLELGIFAKNVKVRTSEITTADIRVYLGKFPHLKGSSIARKLSVLKSFFGWLTGEDIIQRDPTTRINPPKKERRLPKALSIEELELMREHCKTDRQRAFLEVLYATGCRLSEVYSLNRSDIDFHTLSCKVVGKGDKEREVYFSFKAMYHLRKYLNARTDDEQALFVTERKPYRRLSRRGLQREIDVIAKNAGIEKAVSPHTLRHTFATLTLNNGADIVAVQHLLGHSNPSTTQGYAVLSEERKQEQYRKYLVM